MISVLVVWAKTMIMNYNILSYIQYQFIHVSRVLRLMDLHSSKPYKPFVHHYGIQVTQSDQSPERMMHDVSFGR